MTKQVLAALVVALALAVPGLTHAVLMEATPAANGIVAGPEVLVQLRFNSRVDAARSRLTVVLPDHSARTLQLSPQAAPSSLNARITGLTSGAYLLRWQVLAADGHITRGEVPFQVK